VALAAFEAHYVEKVRASLRRVAHGRAELDDLLQNVRARLFVGVGARPPRIAEYAGHGSLTAWLKVVAARVALNQLERVDREDLGPTGDVADEPLLDVKDPELEWLRVRYQEAFAAALGEAFVAMTVEERALLRFHLVDKLGIDEIAPLVGVHRSDVARRLNAARQALVDTTLARLQHRLTLPKTELSSMLRLVRSRLDLDLEALLRSRSSGDAPP
jgi:RNA polymerase sigma-70 factor (ECF subfamily)